MNRLDIRTLVISHTNRPDKADLINSMINAALKKISGTLLWGDLRVSATVTLTPNLHYKALASGVRRLSEARVLDGLSSYKLTIRPKLWLVQRWPDFSEESPRKPRYAYLESATLYLMPPPDQAYVVAYTYYKLHAGLTDDTTDVPDIWDDAVVAYATYRTFKSLQQHEDAVQWFADYQDQLISAKQMDRNAAIERTATPRGAGQPVSEDYYIDPFVKETP